MSDRVKLNFCNFIVINIQRIIYRETNLSRGGAIAPPLNKPLFETTRVRRPTRIRRFNNIT